jgi:hypothetical protein
VTDALTGPVDRRLVEMAAEVLLELAKCGINPSMHPRTSCPIGV